VVVCYLGYLKYIWMLSVVCRAGLQNPTISDIYRTLPSRSKQIQADPSSKTSPSQGSQHQDPKAGSQTVPFGRVKSAKRPKVRHFYNDNMSTSCQRRNKGNKGPRHLWDFITSSQIFQDLPSFEADSCGIEAQVAVPVPRVVEANRESLEPGVTGVVTCQAEKCNMQCNMQCLRNALCIMHLAIYMQLIMQS